eukprot:5608229-Lingulodinium_polyedra.AAC.1
MDYVQTLQNTCAPQGAFKWPATGLHNALNYSRALSVAITHLPPGRMVILKNDRKMPEHAGAVLTTEQPSTAA